jgi:hypothetical protein
MSNETRVTVSELMAEINAAWEELTGYLGTLTEEQMTVPTDVYGWSVKDHLTHLAVWEDGVEALLTGNNRYERMEVDEATWNQHDVDATNAVIRERHAGYSLEDVAGALTTIHERMMTTIGTLTDEDLQRPYRYFDACTDDERPIIGWIVGDTSDHYREHLPWLRAIVEGEAQG